MEKKNLKWEICMLYLITILILAFSGLVSAQGECSGMPDLSNCMGGKCCNETCDTTYDCSLDAECSMETCVDDEWTCESIPDLTNCTGGKCCAGICDNSYFCILDDECSIEACIGNSWACEAVNEGADCSDGVNGDGCYIYLDGCEERDYYCSSGSCVYNYSNRHTDEDVGAPYCIGDQLYIEHHDYGCLGATCTFTSSDKLIDDCDDGKIWTIDTCVGGACQNSWITEPYSFTPSLTTICKGASFPITVTKNYPFAPDTTLIDFYMNDIKVRDNCIALGEELWGGACGIENIALDPGTYTLKAKYTVWGRNYEKVIVDNFVITEVCSTDVQCVHGWTMLSNFVAYNTEFSEDYAFDEGYYILCPDCMMKLRDISAYNTLCSNGVRRGWTANLITWTYNENGTREAISDNGFHIPTALDRNGIIGPSSTTDGIPLTREAHNDQMGVFHFIEPQYYDVYVDMIHTYCDSPSSYVCPWLGGSWRSTLCRMQYFDTITESEGWIPITEYDILIPETNITIEKPEDVFDPLERTIILSWTINNTGTGKVNVSIDTDCSDWDCYFVGYAPGEEMYLNLNSGESSTLFMNVTISATGIIGPKEIGIEVTYDDGYELSCVQPETVDSLVKITIPYTF